MRKTLRGIASFVLAAVLTVACAADIAGEKQIFESKMGQSLSILASIMTSPAVSYQWNGTSVNLTLRDRVEDGMVLQCTYKLNDSKSAFLRIGGDDYCPDSVSVP